MIVSPAEQRSRLRLGAAALGGLAVFTFLPFGLVPLLIGVWPASPIAILADPYLRSVIGFTLMQATLSTVMAVASGSLLALALHRTRFPGRRMLIRLFLLPQALPVLVGALGLLAVFGRNGLVSDAAVLLGFGRLSIYGLPGILLAHVFFNMPLVARLVLGALSGVPAESWRLAGHLALSPAATFRFVEGPALARVLPGASILVFTLCATSFTLVLVLGGGPAATTMEVAIYQALRYDFDPARAVSLALVQIALVATLLVPSLLLRVGDADGFGLGALPRRFDRRPARWRAIDALVILAGTALLVMPLAAVVIRGLAADLVGLIGSEAFRSALSTSLLIAAAASAIGLLASFALARAASVARGRPNGARWRALVFTLPASLVLLVPPVVVGAGWFLALRGWGDVARFAPAVVVLANASIILPFALRILEPEVARADRTHARLAAGLGLVGTARLRHVDLPALRRPLALTLALGLAIALGDLGAVALFGNADLVTLPYLLLQRMGSYRSTDAQGLALLLGGLCLALVVLAEWGLGDRRKGTA